MVMFINRLEKIDEDENSRLTMPKVVSLSTCLDTADKGQCLCFGLFLFFFFFEKIISHGIMHCSVDPQVFYLKKKTLKLGSTVLFTHLKIFLLQYFKFSIFSKISGIQTDPYSIEMTYFYKYVRDRFWREIPSPKTC